MEKNYHELITFSLQAFFSLLVIVNPFSSLPVLISLSQDYTKKEIRTIAFKASMYTFFILTFFLLTGDMLFKILGITLPSFKVGGGILLFLIALNLVQGEVIKEKGKSNEIEAALRRDNIALIPLAMPILAGPGSITTVLVLRASANDFIYLLILVISIFLVSFVAFLVYSFASFLYGILGNSGINLITRISGVLLLAISVQFITDGLKILLK